MKVTSKLVGNTPTQAIDWDKPQLVISKETNTIVLVECSNGILHFSGTVLVKNEGENSVGHYCVDWNRDVFKPLDPTQQVILQNTPDEL
jgi:hypothetical protein